jgi:hypothetical protein
MSNAIQDIQKQTFRYYYQDGLVELAVGILFLVIGIDTFVISSLPPDTPSAVAAWIALPLVTIGGIFWVQRVVKRLKERHVHPRTGYIEYASKPNRYRWLVIGFAFALAISILVLPYEWLQKGSVTGGSILCLILASIGAQVGLKRLIGVGAIGLILGLVFAFLPLTDNASLAASFAATGLILAITGSLAFQNYLKNNPLPTEAPHD